MALTIIDVGTWLNVERKTSTRRMRSHARRQVIPAHAASSCLFSYLLYVVVQNARYAYVDTVVPSARAVSSVVTRRWGSGRTRELKDAHGVDISEPRALP